MFDGKLDTAYRSANNVKAGDEIVVDLGRVEKLNNIYMLMGRTSHDNAVMKGNVQISADGVEWKTVLENNSFRELFVGDLNESARYIKYVATEDQENQVYVREFKVNKNTTSGIRTNVEGNFEYNKSIVERNEVNSIVTTEKVNLKAGDNIGLELPEYKYITSINVNSGIKGNVEYTINGMDWFVLGEVNGETTLSLEKPQVVKQVRFVATEEKSTKKFAMDLVVEGKGEEVVTTNRNGSGNYKDLNAIVDGDVDSSFISSGALKKGDWFTLNLGKVTNVRNIQFIGDKSFGGDRIREGKVEYSLDGETWTEIYNGNVAEEFRMFDLDFNAQYVRMTAVEGTDSWVRMSDFSVNSPEAEVIFESTVKPVNDGHRLDNLMDENIQTSYIPRTDVKSGDRVVYNIFDGALVNNIEIFQNESTISNAKVIARTADDRKIEIGTLDKGYNVFAMEKPEEIVSITLEFQDGSGIPEIYEIVTENFTLEAIKEFAKSNLVQAKELLTKTDGKSEEVINALKTATSEVENALIDGANREDLFNLNRKLENAIKAYIEYSEETKPEEKPEVNPGEKPEVKPDQKPESKPESKPENKPGKLPQTGNAAGVAALLLGVTSLVGGAFAFKKKKK